MKGLITKAAKTILQADGSEFLDVAFDILNDKDEVIDSKALAFSLTTPGEEIQNEVAKYVANYEADAINKEKNAERDAILAKADATIEEIVGKEVAKAVDN